MRKHKIKLSIKTDRELRKKTPCSICSNPTEYGKLNFYVDESNIAITNNSKGICINCKN
tara:strand:- start:290 stop:466 length:177 start_codon:yes stop_codon:yes gene_type:complete